VLWKDIDFVSGQLSINRSLHQLKDGSFVFRLPKTAKGKRTIALTPKSFLVLQAYYEEQKKLCASLGIPLTDDRLVFCHIESGAPIRPNTVTRAWAIIAAKAGLKHIRLHDARHSHASVLLKQGVHPNRVLKNPVLAKNNLSYRHEIGVDFQIFTPFSTPC
jgi:integrase